MRGALHPAVVFVLGGAVGVGVGWALFHAPQPAPDVVKTARPQERGDQEGATPTLTASPQAPAPSAPVDAARLAALRTGTAQQIYEAFPGVSKRTVPAEALPILAQRLEEALRARDKGVFGATAALLHDAKHPDARQLFVRLTLDESVDLPSDAGRWFGPVLAGARSPGLAAAARRRFEAASRGGRSWITDAWIQVVVAAGGSDDLDWVLTQTDPRTATAAFGSSANPLAVERYREAIWKDEEAMGALSNHIERNADGWTWAVEVAEQALAGKRALPDDEGLKNLLATLARHAPESEIGRVQGLLVGIRDQGHRIAALPAVGLLAKRGVEIRGELDAIVQAPRLALESVARGTDDAWQGIHVSSLIYAIEYNRITWSEAAVRALEALASRETFAHHARHVAELIRAALESPWKDG